MINNAMNMKWVRCNTCEYNEKPNTIYLCDTCAVKNPFFGVIAYWKNSEINSAMMEYLKEKNTREIIHEDFYLWLLEKGLVEEEKI